MQKWVGRISLGTALLALILLLSAFAGYRSQFLVLVSAFLFVRSAVYLAIAAIILGMIALATHARSVFRGGPLSPILGICVGLLIALPIFQLKEVAGRLPRIHDISTDLEDPPHFQALLPLRLLSPNGAEYGGKEVADGQRQAYPDIQSLNLSAPFPQAYALALKAARDMGWEIIAEDPASGRIEATQTSFWFGFKDDIVVRVALIGTGSKVDVRSASRVGISDIGKNAERIRAYLKRLIARCIAEQVRTV